MASKRQRRRREKLHRHEYELVELDESGRESVVKPNGKQSQPKPGGKLVDQRGRVIQPPSWPRALKRGLIFAPILAILIFATGRNISTAAKLLNIIVLLLIFLPTTYLMDRVLYNRVLRKQREQGKGRS
jgi:hypothetical protein